MDYNRIVAVTGMPGLYEVVSSKTDGAIVRSLEDKSTRFVSSRVHNLSHLESIEVYTVRENVTLSDVFSAMKQSGGALPDTKDNKVLKAYFEKVFPDLDFERVYTSDMKKMVKWYEVLNENEIDFTAKPEEEAEEVAVGAEEQEEKSEKPRAKAPAKKTASKKAAPKKTSNTKTTARAATGAKRTGRKKTGE
ncbi:MAG: DUF5606 domain-containing protein [Flavisolibacter sp.]